ncbi:MAG: aliphatic sulfonate ABC transporter substrate-binding protein [Clostridiales Family XIII bacterium]|jgi:sulfonate transport system substrate-binding protein|nr:aliphatic sulfonate ABC transporter substrate-binding protein [Clostridiales Family XIII bacterium]
MKSKLIKFLAFSLVLAFAALPFAGCSKDASTTAQPPADAAAPLPDGDAAPLSSEPAAQKDEGAVLRIGAQPFPLYSSIYVAKELGFIEEELDAVGATFVWTEFNSGPLVNEAVAAGTQDIGFMADQPAIVAKASGQPIQIISNVAYGEKALALLVSADSPVTKVEELKGKKVALVVGSYAQHLLVLLLENAGLTVDDIELINLPASEQPAVLAAGQVDAIVVWEQYISLLTTSGQAKVIADGTGIKRGNMVTYAVTSYAEKHPLVIEAYIRASQRAADYIDSNPKEAAAAIAETFGVTDDVMEEILKKFSFSPELTAADISEITTVKDYLLKVGIIKNDVDAGEFFNDSYYKAAFGG